MITHRPVFSFFLSVAAAGALSALVVQVSPVVGSVALTTCSLVSTVALLWFFVQTAQDTRTNNVASANRLLSLVVGLFTACTLTVLATLNWLHLAKGPTFTLRFARFESTALARAGLAVYSVTFFLAQGGFTLVTIPDSLALEAVIIWLQLCSVAFNAVLVPIVTSRILATRQQKSTAAAPRPSASLLTRAHPLVSSAVLVFAGMVSMALFWRLAPLAGLVSQVALAAVVLAWMWELLYRRVWLSLLYTGQAQPLRDGDSALDTVGEWIQPAVVGLAGSFMLVFATTASTLLLERTLAPERTESRTLFAVPLGENGLASTLRLAHYAVVFVGGGSFSRNEPAHLGSALALVPATLVIMAVRVAVLSTGVAGGLAAVTSSSSTETSRTAAAPP